MNIHEKFTPSDHTESDKIQQSKEIKNHLELAEQFTTSAHEQLSILNDSQNAPFAEQASFSKNCRTVSENKKGEFVFFEKGNPVVIDETDVIHAGEWGASLAVGTDPSLRSDSHKESDETIALKKSFLAKESDRLNQFHQHTAMAIKESGEKYNDIQGINPYDHFVTLQAQEDYEKEEGHLTEKMIRTCLSKMAHRHGLPFTVHESNPTEDITFKIDMLVQFDEGYLRGLSITDKDRVGVQVTSSEKKKALQKKSAAVELGKEQLRLTKEQDRPADDIVYFGLGINKEVQEAYKQWRQNADGSYRSLNKCDPRGPEQFMSKDTEIRMLRATLKNLPKGMEDVRTDILKRMGLEQLPDDEGNRSFV